MEECKSSLIYSFFISCTHFVAHDFSNSMHFVVLGYCVLCCYSTEHAQFFSVLVILGYLKSTVWYLTIATKILVCSVLF